MRRRVQALPWRVALADLENMPDAFAIMRRKRGYVRVTAEEAMAMKGSWEL